MKITYASNTIAGRRGTNQDFLCVESITISSGKEARVLIVADGMGGPQAGDVASKMACDHFMKYLRENASKTRASAIYFRKLLIDAIHDTHDIIAEKSMNNKDLRGMGTTMVVVLIWDNYYVVANVGDSRAYLVYPEYIEQITKDQSEVQLMVDRGILTPEEARIHPHRNLISQNIGDLNEIPIPDLFPVNGAFRIDTGSMLLLCSDGLNDGLTDSQMHEVIVQNNNVEEVAEKLPIAAFNSGSKDNISSILLEFGNFDRKSAQKNIKTKPKLLDVDSPKKKSKVNTLLDKKISLPDFIIYSILLLIIGAVSFFLLFDYEFGTDYEKTISKPPNGYVVLKIQDDLFDIKDKLAEIEKYVNPTETAPIKASIDSILNILDIYNELISDMDDIEYRNLKSMESQLDSIIHLNAKNKNLLIEKIESSDSIISEVSKLKLKSLNN